MTLKESLIYSSDMIGMYIFVFWQKVNRHLLITYRPHDNFTRCRKCGRDIHDYTVPSEVWRAVANDTDCYCYDCFCDIYEKKTGKSWRIN